MNLEHAKNAFQKYLQDFNIKDGKIQLKIRHTYGVMIMSEYIAKDLNLSTEDIELAILIALLHDIGRFEQAKQFQDFRDYNNIDHADLGVQILFKDNLIREFIQDLQYDNIIETAIRNHNNLNIEEGLEGKQLLHTKIIRDADKADNFRVKAEESFSDIFNSSKEAIENSRITDKIFNDFMNNKVIVSSERVTDVDHWVSYLAFIFDFNFDSGLKYINDKDYIDIIIDRMDYKIPETRARMEEIRLYSKNFINKRLDNA